MVRNTWLTHALTFSSTRSAWTGGPSPTGRSRRFLGFHTWFVVASSIRPAFLCRAGVPTREIHATRGHPEKRIQPTLDIHDPPEFHRIFFFFFLNIFCHLLAFSCTFFRAFAEGGKISVSAVRNGWNGLGVPVNALNEVETLSHKQEHVDCIQERNERGGPTCAHGLRRRERYNTNMHHRWPEVPVAGHCVQP